MIKPTGDRWVLRCSGNLIGDNIIASFTGVDTSACGAGPNGGHGW